MAQNITFMGANYADVPSVLLPKTGGGTAQFDDTTDANATAEDIASGKTAYVNGTKITGTSSGGSVSVTDEANATGTTCVISTGSSPTPSETYETIYDQTTSLTSEGEDSYAWVSSLAGIMITEGSRWRVTWDGTTRVHDAVYGVPYEGGSSIWHINSLTDGTNGSYILHNFGDQAWLFIDFVDTSSHVVSVKVEQRVTE